MYVIAYIPVKMGLRRLSRLALGEINRRKSAVMRLRLRKTGISYLKTVRSCWFGCRSHTVKAVVEVSQKHFDKSTVVYCINFVRYGNIPGLDKAKP
jgi:hypothetical protein